MPIIENKTDEDQTIEITPEMIEAGKLAVM